MREIAEQYISLLCEIRLLKTDMETLDPKMYPAEARDTIREIRSIRVQRIKKNIADVTAFRDWVASISEGFVKKAMVLRYVKGYTWDEVATRLGGGNTGDAVKHLCHRYFSRYGQRNWKTDTAK